jgi:hypothetical protein
MNNRHLRSKHPELPDGWTIAVFTQTPNDSFPVMEYVAVIAEFSCTYCQAAADDPDHAVRRALVLWRALQMAKNPEGPF